MLHVFENKNDFLKIKMKMKSPLCSPRLHLFDEKYNKNSNSSEILLQGQNNCIKIFLFFIYLFIIIIIFFFFFFASFH